MEVRHQVPWIIVPDNGRLNTFQLAGSQDRVFESTTASLAATSLVFEGANQATFLLGRVQQDLVEGRATFADGIGLDQP